MSEYLDDVFDSLEYIVSIEEKLSKLSSAFSVTGNDIVSEDLYHICTELEGCRETIKRAVAKNV